MKKFTELTGYNANHLCKHPHVFIYGEGCFSESPELARLHNKKTGNEVGLHIVEKEHEGVVIYKEVSTNVWD